MSPENKQRVVGVIVLVGFIALLIPFLFAGKKNRHPLAETEIAIPDQGPTNEQMIEVEAIIDQPADQQRGLDNTNISSPDVEVISNVLSSPEHATKPNIFPQTLESEQPVAEVVKGAQVQALLEPKTELQPVVQEVAKPVVSQRPVIKAKSKPRVLKKSKAIASSTNKVWSVQVGSFANHKMMQRMVDKIQAQGFHVYLQKITTSKGPMVRVLVGHESTKGAAVKLAKDLKTKMNLDGRIIGNTK